MIDEEFADLVEQKSIGKKIALTIKKILKNFLVMKIFQSMNIYFRMSFKR